MKKAIVVTFMISAATVACSPLNEDQVATAPAATRSAESIVSTAIAATEQAAPTSTPTSTLEPTSTETPIPSPTPLPGLLVLPVDTPCKTIPWLPMDNTARPAVNFVGFNFQRPPFNSATVRQAFAYAIDREPLLDMAERYKASNPTAATSLTPPQTLGRDLYGEVGAAFDPQRAKDLLTQAGYSDPSAFPVVVLLVNAFGDIAPGARFNMATAMADMWKTHLGIDVQIQVVPSFAAYYGRLDTNPPALFWFGWAADYNDPDNFLREIFHSGAQFLRRFPQLRV